MKSHLEQLVASHYRQADLVPAILNRIAQVAKNAATLTIDDLAVVDEFHTGGARATDLALAGLNFKPEMKILDAGCGIGGTARRIADRFGCHVTGIDITDEYIQTAVALTQKVKLQDLCHFQRMSVLDTSFDDASFDGCVSLHVAMNIADRAKLYREVCRVTKQSGLFVSYDLIRGSNPAPLKFPLPWSETSEGSFLLSRSDTVQLLRENGFDSVRAIDLNPALQAGASTTADGNSSDQTAKPTPNLLLGNNAAQKVKNHKLAMQTGRIAPYLFLSQKLD